jgi:peptide chain release factor subunit 1
VLHDRIVIVESVVRQLAAGWSSQIMVSFYLDIDGRRYPRPSDYAPHVEQLFRLARKSAEAEGQHGVDAVEADLSRIAGWLDSGLDRKTTRGVAVFSCQAQDLFDVFSLPISVRDQVVVGRGPDVAQLCAILATSEQSLVVAVDRQRSRLLRLECGDADVDEREAPIDETARQVDTNVELGSFERRHEELARQHYRHVARAVADELEERPAARIVLCGQQESVARLEEYLPERVVALIVGRIALPLSSGRAELARAASEIIRAVRRQHQIELIDELRARASEGAGTVTGLAATLDALGAGQVETLVVEEGFEARGGRCRDCGQLVSDGALCARCGAAPIPMENVVDAAITEAFTHHVALEFCEEADLAGLGHIGAFERR